MQFTQSISYPGTVDEVVAMYLTPDYLERRFGRFVVEGSTTVSVEGKRVSYAGTVRPELIPAAAARFVKSDLRVTFTEEWTLNEAGASPRGERQPVGARAAAGRTHREGDSGPRGSPDRQRAGERRAVAGGASLKLFLRSARNPARPAHVARAGGVFSRHNSAHE